MSRRQKDEEMAKFMKKHPGRFPNCFTRRVNPITRSAMGMGRVPVNPNRSPTFSGYVGGVLAERLGFKSPVDLPNV